MDIKAGDKTKLRIYAECKRFENSITNDGHTMLISDVVKDLNDFYRGFVKQKETIKQLEQKLLDYEGKTNFCAQCLKLEQDKAELESIMCMISAHSISADNLFTERDILLKFRMDEFIRGAKALELTPINTQGGNKNELT